MLNLQHSGPLLIITIINFLFLIFIFFTQRKNPATTWAWLLVVATLPLVGFCVYIFLGLDARKHYVFSEKAKKDKDLFNDYIKMEINNNNFLTYQFERVKHKHFLKQKGAEHYDDMLYLNFISGNGPYNEFNDVSVFNNGVDKFESLLKDILNAKNFIHMEYYIVKDCNLTLKILDALTKKAKEGVEVKFLLDGMGCFLTNKKIFKSLINAGGKVSIFLPPYFTRINFRNHRKIAVIDGVIGYVGGLNIGDEYLGISKRFGFWRDCHIRVDGEASKQLEIRFIMDWNFACKDKIVSFEKYFPPLCNKTGGIGMQIVSSGPDTKWPSIMYSYEKMISEADKTLFIATPYFVPDDSILESVRVAALSGIDVKIIIPAVPDHPFVYSAALSYLSELIQAGATCYLYEKGFIHSKVIIVDSLISSVGTANLDIRSFKLNFEVNAFMYDEKIAKELEENFLHDLKDCKQLTLDFYKKRSFIFKIKESIARLIAPLL